ncbi:MAG: efflux RND transporter permease subunit [Campylobacterales bacterium]|nr:efflux RND transporter permease subunit [Campylobacterales bacterium]
MYKFAINRPITTLMGVLAFIVFGLISYKTMPVNLFPNVDFPVVTVQTEYRGADAATVESKVTDVIEESVSGIDGIDKLFSSSYNGLSVVTIQFELSKDLNEATNDVRDKIGSALLPSEVEKPVVKKLGASGVAISLFISTKKDESSSLMRFADENVKPKLQRIEGVGEVELIGFRDREIRVFVNPFLLDKYGLTTYDLSNKIKTSNVNLGAGELIDQKDKITIKTKGDADSIEELKSIIIKPGVQLGDVATVVDGLSDIESYSSSKGEVGVKLDVKKIPGKNTLNIIRDVKKIYPSLVEMAGKEYDLKLLNDQSEKIMVNINNVTFDLIFGAFLAIVIVFLFLRNVRTTIISAMAIPTSIIGTFAIIDWLGYDLNRLTLIGLTLAIGIFIDDAIIVIENISKKMEAGIKPFEASYEGIKEIVFSILAISSVLLAVFIPVAYMDGIVGMFFNSFAMTVASGVVISFLVATMLIPSLSARLLDPTESKFYHMTEPILQKIDALYVSMLKPILKFKYITIIVTVLLLILSAKLNVGMNFLPMQDYSEFQVQIKTPTGANIETTKKMVQPLVNEINANKLVDYSILSIGYNTAREANKAQIYVKLIPVKDRDISQEDIVQEYSDKFAKFKDMKIVVEEVSPFETGGSNAAIQIVITGDSLDKLSKISQKAMDILAQTQGTVGIDSDYEAGNPEIQVHILRDRAERMGVDVQDIASVLNSAYSSETPISYYEENGKEYDITLRLDDKHRSGIFDLYKLKVRNANNELVPIDSLVEIERGVNVTSINRYDRSRKVLVTSGIFGNTLDKIIASINPKLKEIMPKGYSYTYSGDVENMEDTNKAFGAAVLLAIVLIYLILASLYESFVQPFIIMVAMPLSITGIMFALFLGGKSFSLFVMIGIILLLGMVGKNAILVVDFANKAIAEGKEIDAALFEAGEKRLRPILMTTFAMIGAMMPLAFGSGAGHESNSPMALAIIGGLTSSTLLTLLVVPAIYKVMYPLDRWLRKWYEKGKVL